MKAITVFISYSHDSDEHRERVLALSERLRQDGIETLLDQYINGSPQQGWPRWMLDQLDAADFVLVVCTETYYRRFRGHEVPDKGKGVDWEGALITQEIYDQHSRTLKFVPVFLSAAVEDWLPEPLGSATYYALTSEGAYQRLYDSLLKQAGVEPRPVGKLKTKARRAGIVLAFDESPPSKTTPNRVDISRLTHSAEKLVGREAELKRLDEAWNDPAQHVLIIRGIGGEGKTSLVVDWSSQLALRDYDGASYFDWSFYSQGTRDQTSASSDSFIAAALEFFGSYEGKKLASSPASARDKAVKLLEYIRIHRTLLVLDGLEPLQYPPGPLAGQLRDDAMVALLTGLAQSNPGLCVVTTREPVTDLARFQDSTAPDWELDHLSEIAGTSLLQRLLEPLRPKGVHQVRSTAEERMEISRAVKGHALTLRLLGGFIHRALRDVRRWREVDYSEADEQYKTNAKNPHARYGHAFKTIEAYEMWLVSGGSPAARQLAVLRLLGLFDRPADPALIAALRSPPIIPGLTDPLINITTEEWNTTLSELEECGLVALAKNESIDAHPLLREYFARQLRAQQLEAWCAAHRLLYQHLRKTTSDKKPNPTLEDLQPLYQAVAHGCQAGMQEEARVEVYRNRIQRGQEFYSTKKLGAFASDLGAVACFFETPWNRVSKALTDADKSFLLNAAAHRLRALGRLTEALEPMRVSGEMDVKREEWRGAAISYSNLSELEMTLGEVIGAVEDAEQSVTFADRSGDADWSSLSRVSHARVLHQAGRHAEAEARFREAEQMQVEQLPAYPLLSSVQGYYYCDLLLTDAERGAWQRVLGTRATVVDCANPTELSGPTSVRDAASATEMEGDRLEHSKAPRVVSERAAQTIKIAERNNWLLDIALDHLTLGRCALYVAILEDRYGPLNHPRSLQPGDATSETLATAHCELDAAITGLRRAGTIHHIPLGLLTRAWLRSLTGAHVGPEGAQSDLDEGWEIAERGPMPLFLADIHLYRARLFGRMKYPWESPKKDLAEARRLIEKHGYWRRKEELEDAEAALIAK